MTLFNPATLVDQLHARWNTIPLLRSQPAPSRSQLLRLLETAYSASMMKEEGRPLQFGLILLNRDDTDQKEFTVLRFRECRPLTAGEIRRLAPATKLSSAFIAVEWIGEDLQIWGTVDIGSEWTLLQSGERSSGILLPLKLVCTVSAPGTLTLSLSDHLLLFSVEHGQLANTGSNVLKFGPIHEFFRPTIARLLSEALPSMLDHDTKDHFFASYGGQYLRFLARTLRFAEKQAHGGTVVIVRESEARRAGNFLAIKYETLGVDLWKELLLLLQYTYDEIEQEKALDDPGQVQQEALSRWRMASNNLRKSEQRLNDLSRFLAQLMQVDGAFILTDQLRILGFGAIVKELSSSPLTMMSCRDEECRTFIEVKSDVYGTRHRSAIRLCQEVDGVAFVLSQDGGVKALKGVSGKVLLWPSVTLNPSSWFVTAEDVIPQLREKYLSRKGPLGAGGPSD